MGAGELLIIAVIGLLVLGPERLPVAIRTVSGWIRSAKQMANGITSEINHELKVQELHQNLKKAEEQGLQNLSPELSETVQELKDAAASVNRPYANTAQEPATGEQPRSPYSPKPKVDSPEPQVEGPEPQVEGPEPQVESPEPNAESPEPKVESPEPHETSAKPTVNNTSPTSDKS